VFFLHGVECVTAKGGRFQEQGKQLEFPHSDGASNKEWSQPNGKRERIEGFCWSRLQFLQCPKAVEFKDFGKCYTFPEKIMIQ